MRTRPSSAGAIRGLRVPGGRRARSSRTTVVPVVSPNGPVSQFLTHRGASGSCRSRGRGPAGRAPDVLLGEAAGLAVGRGLTTPGDGFLGVRQGRSTSSVQGITPSTSTSSPRPVLDQRPHDEPLLVPRRHDGLTPRCAPRARSARRTAGAAPRARRCFTKAAAGQQEARRMNPPSPSAAKPTPGSVAASAVPRRHLRLPHVHPVGAGEAPGVGRDGDRQGDAVPFEQVARARAPRTPGAARGG